MRQLKIVKTVQKLSKVKKVEKKSDGYKQEVMDNLLVYNSFFRLPEETRYEVFKNIDPFPDISASLLNSEDIFKYVMTCGMIENFDCTNLAGAIYTCEFSGEYHRWDDQKVKCNDTLKNNEKLELGPNSITFIAVKQHFRIPLYMVLRFNLRVSHVYKGLLLGTGPIVDPGFCGQIFIPLHNLTSNTYRIKKNAPIIEVEFTKMSKNPEWDIKQKKDHKDIVDCLNFGTLKYQKDPIQADRGFDHYIRKALNNEWFYKKNKTETSINSSLPEEIHQFDEKIETFHKRVTEAEDKLKKDSDRMEKTENYVKTFTFVAFLSVVMACFSLAWSVYSYLSSSTATKINEAEKKIETQKQINDDAQKKYEKNSTELERRINELEQRVKTQ